MDNNHQLTTPAIDLLAPSNRFATSSRLYGRLHRYQILLRRLWWVIGLVFVCLLVPAYLITAELPPAYKSKARLWLTGRLNINEGRIYTEELIDYLSTQAELLRSSTVEQRALARVRSQYPDEFSATRDSSPQHGFLPVREAKAFLKRLAGLDTAGTNAVEDVCPFTLKVTEASKSSTLDLVATGPAAASTRAYLNCVMDEYLAFKRETRTKAADQALASVNGDVRHLADELKAQQAKLHNFQTSNNVVFLQEQGSSAGSYLAQLNRQIATLSTQLQLLQRLNPEQWMDEESRRAAGNTGDPAEASAREALATLAGSQADLFKASQQVQLLKAKRDELSRFLRPLHPKIVKLNEDIATQERLVRISKDEALKQLATRRQALQLEITNLESAFRDWDVKAISSSRKIADYDAMRQDLQRLQTAYDHLFGLMQTVDIGKTMEQENVGVLEPASAARLVPRMVINMAVALMAALAASFACLYCLGMFDDRFASLTELSSYFNEEVLGQVPAIPHKDAESPLGRRVLERQRFEFLEAFRTIRSSLLYMSNGKTRPKTILITSSVPREGKSTVALYLSATMAMANSRVLLIDADMRQSTLHRLLALRSAPGLAEVLDGQVSPASAIIPTSMENLSLLPAGAAKRNPGELVLSSEWTRFMSELYAEFDYILIDSPPLLATNDAAGLAPKLDGVLMIVRGAFTSARMARRALDLLRQRQAHVLGLVFNRARFSSSEYHYYQRYRNEYQWRPPASAPAPSLACGRASQTNEAG